MLHIALPVRFCQCRQHIYVCAHLCVCTLAAPKEVWMSHSITRSWQIHAWQIHAWLIQNVSFSHITHDSFVTNSSVTDSKLQVRITHSYLFLIPWLIRDRFIHERFTYTQWKWLIRTLFLFNDSFVTDSFVTHSDSCMMQRRSVGSFYICMHVSSS